MIEMSKTTYMDTFWEATSALETLADCRGNNPGPEEDAECDSIDALLEYLESLEWEYNVAALDEEGDTMYLLWGTNWLGKESADVYRDKVIGEQKVTGKKIVRRVKAGKVEDYND